jgi:hypothetical protein
MIETGGRRLFELIEDLSLRLAKVELAKKADLRRPVEREEEPEAPAGPWNPAGKRSLAA